MEKSSKRSLEYTIMAELVQEIRELRSQNTDQFAQWLGRIQNSVLLVETRAIPASGYLDRQFRTPAGSIEVSNPSEHAVTVDAAPPGGTAPAQGTGVYIIPAGTTRVVNVASRQITLYGTAGDIISFQVFATGGVSRPSLNSVDGGTA